jgi:hypothetical protein
MNREVRRPARTLQAARAGRVGQPATDLIESGLRILSAKSGIRRVRRGQAWENRQCRRNSQRRPVQHVASPQRFPPIEYNAAIHEPSGFQSGDRHVSESCAAVVCCYNPGWRVGWHNINLFAIANVAGGYAGAVGPCFIDPGFVRRLC